MSIRAVEKTSWTFYEGSQISCFSLRRLKVLLTKELHTAVVTSKVLVKRDEAFLVEQEIEDARNECTTWVVLQYTGRRLTLLPEFRSQ